MSGIARALKKCLPGKKVEFNPIQEPWSVDPLTGMLIAPREPSPEFDDSPYFWCPGMPMPEPTSAEWNLGLDGQLDNNWQCPYCNGLHPLTKYTCPNCGAARIKEY